MPFQGKNESFVPSKTKDKTPQKKTKQKKTNKTTNKEGLGPSEVTLGQPPHDPQTL